MNEPSLAQLAGRLCNDEMFQAWLREHFAREWNIAEAGWAWTESEVAAVVVRRVCEVKSRAAFDTDAQAAARFHERIRKPFAHTQESEHV